MRTDLHHSSLPLTVNLRLPEVQRDSNGGSDDQFQEIVRLIQHALEHGEVDSTLPWSYKYDSLWWTRFQVPGTTGNRGKLLHFHSGKSVYQILIRHTYWATRLRKTTQSILKHRLYSGELKLLDLKEYCHTVDGVIISFILGCPEIFRSESTYAVSDRIISGIMSSCIHNYSQVVKDTKRIRKEMKWHIIQQLEYVPHPTLIRRNSWWIPVIEKMNSIREIRSKSTIFRLACLTQTRATGLADKKMAEETINEFIDEVTKWSEFKPSPVLVEAIDEYTDRIVLNGGGVTTKFKISMSTSACFESGRKKEGKFGFLKSLIPKYIEAPPPLLEGVGGSIGTPIFLESRPPQGVIFVRPWKGGIHLSMF